MAITLTREEELQAAYVAGTIVGKGCIGIAKGLKAAGWLIGKGGKMTALGLTIAAEGVARGSGAAETFLNNRGDDVLNFGKKYSMENEEANDRVVYDGTIETAEGVPV